MKQQLGDTIDFLQGREGLFIVLVGALFVQAPHSAEVFYRISTSHWPAIASWTHAAFFAGILEVAVLLFVIRGRKELSWGFAGISVLMNVFYYYDPVWWTGSAGAPIVMCIVTSIALPLAIAFYSHEVAKQDVPLVQLAAVHGAQPAKDQQALQPVVQASGVQSAKSSTQEIKPDAQPKPAQASDEDARRARLLKSEGLTNIQIADQLGVHRNTVGNLLKQSAIHTNGHSVKEVSQ